MSRRASELSREIKAAVQEEWRLKHAVIENRRNIKQVSDRFYDELARLGFVEPPPEEDSYWVPKKDKYEGVVVAVSMRDDRVLHGYSLYVEVGGLFLIQVWGPELRSFLKIRTKAQFRDLIGKRVKVKSALYPENLHYGCVVGGEVQTKVFREREFEYTHRGVTYQTHEQRADFPSEGKFYPVFRYEQDGKLLEVLE